MNPVLNIMSISHMKYDKKWIENVCTCMWKLGILILYKLNVNESEIAVTIVKPFNLFQNDDRNRLG